MEAPSVTKSSSDPLEVGNPSTNTGAQPNPNNNGVRIEEQAGNKVEQVEEHRIPIVNLIRIMRRGLPPQVKISDGAKETVQLCVSEFISFITSEANERCKEESRKIVTAEDIIWAMDRLGFEDYIGPLVLYLQRYRMNGVDILVPREGHFPMRQNIVSLRMPLPPPTLQPQLPSYGSDFPTIPVACGLNKDGSGASTSRGGNDQR